VRKILNEILPGPIDVVGDMEIALEAAFGDGPGVIVVAGTGSIAYGRNQHGQTARAGGWGFAVGDEGSAHWIGREAVRALLRAADQHVSAGLDTTPFALSLLKAWGVTSILDLARAGNAVPPPDFAALFPAVVSNDDELAKEVLTRAGRELARIAALITRRLFSMSEAECVPVATTGSVFRYAPVVRQIFYNELRSLDARVQVDQRIVDPVEGALRMARRAAKASDIK